MGGVEVMQRVDCAGARTACPARAGSATSGWRRGKLQQLSSFRQATACQSLAASKPDATSCAPHLGTQPGATDGLHTRVCHRMHVLQQRLLSVSRASIRQELCLDRSPAGTHLATPGKWSHSSVQLSPSQSRCLQGDFAFLPAVPLSPHAHVVGSLTAKPAQQLPADLLALCDASRQEG